MFLKLLFLISFCLFNVWPVSAKASASQPMSHRSVVEIRDSAVSINGPIYIVSNGQVEKISFPNLEFVNGPIYIVSNAKLKSVSFPKLSFVNGPIYISYNFNLETVHFETNMYVNGPIYYYLNKSDTY